MRKQPHVVADMSERKSTLRRCRGAGGGGWGVVFFNDTATTEIYTLTLHDALPIYELQPFLEGAALITKSRYSGFYETGLEQELGRINPDEVLVVGVCTDICVMYTVAGLRNRGYRVTVPGDCVETYDAPGHNAEQINRFALDHMRDILGARVE